MATFEKEQRQRAEEQEGAELAPPGGGAVDHPAGEQVRKGVPGADDEEQRPHRGGRYPDDVGVVEQQEHRRHRERHVVGGVPGAIAEELSKAKTPGVLCVAGVHRSPRQRRRSR
jgi:hypothetical protein